MNLVIFNNSLRPSELQTVMTWCENYFGPGAVIHNTDTADRNRWGHRFDLGGLVILFIRDDQDHMLFRLRWSHLTVKTRH